MNWIVLIAVVAAVVVCLTGIFYIVHTKRLAKAVAKAAEQARKEGYEAGLGLVLAPHSMHDLPRPHMYVFLKALQLSGVDAPLWIMRRIGEKSEDQLMTRLIHEEFPGKLGEAFMIDTEGTFRQPPHHTIARPAQNESRKSRSGRPLRPSGEEDLLKVTAPPPPAPPAAATETAAPAAPAAANGSGAGDGSSPTPMRQTADNFRARAAAAKRERDQASANG